MRLTRPLAAIALYSFLASAALGSEPRRVAKGHVVTSSADPAVRIVVPTSSLYVGSNEWVLYGIADCRQFVYVEPGADRQINRLYWIQFESYVPTMPKLHHLYTSKRHVKLGGLDFYVDTWLEANVGPGVHVADTSSLAAYLRARGYALPAAIHSGSDEQHVDALLSAGKYRLPSLTMSVRFVHLADSAKRKELMLIYTEDAGSTGLAASDDRSGAAGNERWRSVERGLIRRAEARLAVDGSAG